MRYLCSPLYFIGMTLVEDPSYRYKMPRIMAKVEGRGNGIKTVLVNVTDLGTSLNREAPEITKFFGCEIGSQTSFSADTDRAIVNGAHTAADLQVHLCRYIENFVLCENCRLPETHYKIKAGLISQKCLACGHKSTVDMTHKLTTFILAQHKKAKEIAVKAEKGGDKKGDKKKDKKEGTASEETKAAPVVEMTDAEATAAKADKKAKKDKLKESGEGKKKSKSSASADNGDKEGVEESGDAEEEETDSRAAGKHLRLHNYYHGTISFLFKKRIIQIFIFSVKAAIFFIHGYI
jgi:translation initiation factor 5